ncbi:scavenger receptor cysteine-rich domain superfamily protein-like [Oculina patagonica]
MSISVISFLVQGVLLLTLKAEDKVRLVSNGTIASQGRVEVMHNGEWGTVCETEWDLEDANIVCHQLGYDGAKAAPTSKSSFGEGTGKIWMNKVQCVGNESAITDCTHDGWGIAVNCSHKEDASVVCNPSVRLVGGPSRREGLVQVYYNKTWGWVCDDQWNNQGADVVCRELGFTGSSTFYTSTAIDVSKGATWLNNPRCAGNESSLFSCTHDGWGSQSCLNNKKSGVRCIKPQVRLSGGDSTFYGRVEIFYSGLWGTVCDEWWNLQSARVICRQLGFDGAVAARPWSAFGKGEGVIWMTHVQCTGDESSIADCFFNGWGISSCPLFHHYRDASAVCIHTVRLVNGPSSREGLVQVYLNNTWGYVCDNNWSRQDADVVCKMMGYTGSYPSHGQVVVEWDNTTTWLNNVRCVGNEGSLFLCAHDGWRRQRCPSNEQAIVACNGPEVRLTYGNVPYRGQVEVLHNGIWGTVCSYHWDLQDANVACRHLGYENAEAASDPLREPQSVLHKLARTITKGGAVWLSYVQCVGSEFSLLECRHSGWAQNSCNHIEDASVVCSHQVASVAKPRMISSGLQSINLKWNSCKSKSYRVQIYSNDSHEWGEAMCYGSTVAGSCVVNSTLATVKGLLPSSVYFFRIQPANGTVSPTSEAMKTKSLATPDRPFFKAHTTRTITVGWTPILLQSTIYKLEVNLHQTPEWRDAVCTNSTSPGRCIVEKSYATVTGLNDSVIYHFRVYAIFDGAKSEPSMPSIGLSPQGQQDLPRIDRNISSNNISCDRKTKCTLFCHASSNGPVRYTWTKDGKPLNRSDVIIINNVLVIKPRTKGDYGLYVCKVENEAGGVELGMNVTGNSGRMARFSKRKEINGEDQRLSLLPAVIVLGFALCIVSVVIFWLKWRKRVFSTNMKEQETELQTQDSSFENTSRALEGDSGFASHEYQKLESEI